LDMFFQKWICEIHGTCEGAVVKGAALGDP
jgi:hypothetical protein